MNFSMMGYPWQGFPQRPILSGGWWESRLWGLSIVSGSWHVCRCKTHTHKIFTHKILNFFFQFPIQCKNFIPRFLEDSNSFCLSENCSLLMLVINFETTLVLFYHIKHHTKLKGGCQHTVYRQTQNIWCHIAGSKDGNFNLDQLCPRVHVLRLSQCTRFVFISGRFPTMEIQYSQRHLLDL